MIDVFLEFIEQIYKIILEPIDSAFKIVAIENYKTKIGIGKNEKFSDYYYKFIQLNKEKGIVYTPQEIADFIIKNTIEPTDIIKNPYMKIVDPACGSGNLIIPCYKYLMKIYEDNIDLINKNNDINLNKNNLGAHIILNNLYGYDIDENALKVLITDLFTISNVVSNNFLVKDFLTEDLNHRFDVYISNPPYVGQKSVNREYSIKLKALYRDIYKDKGDISYCFFQKSIINLNKKGKLAFITSRYFLESPSGEELRKILKELCSIYKIIDFYGLRPFKKVGIDPVIIFLTNEQEENREIEVIKPLESSESNKKLFQQSLFLNNGDHYKKFYINKNVLNNKGWILRDEKERNIINRIEKNSFTNLSNICNSYQGIITGCDNAFIIDKYTIEHKQIEQALIRPWIKSSYINKNIVKDTDKYIIYSDFIENEIQYPNSIKHIEQYKERLIKRRECEKGIRKWYELQWGRDNSIFEKEKIVFPYKAKNNRFAKDKGSYFSADVYALVLKDNVPFTYEYLLFLLNSKVYEFYFKTFAKKLGEDLYEYYPNNIMKLCIPTMNEALYKSEYALYKSFGFSDEEIQIIEKQTASD